MNKKSVSVVITSCGRLEYLKKTIQSFLKHNTYPIFEYLIIEDSQDIKTINYIESQNIFNKVIINKNNLGQAASLNKIYRYVKGNYVIHLEDDCEFIKNGNFIEQGIDILNTVAKVHQVWFNKCIHNSDSHYHFIKEVMISKKDIKLIF